jgi:hypothetical protein
MPFANVEPRGEAPDAAVRILSKECRGQARHQSNAAFAQIRIKEPFHAGKSPGARPCLREHLDEQRNSAGTKEVVKANPGVDEILYALSREARRCPRAILISRNAASRPRELEPKGSRGMNFCKEGRARWDRHETRMWAQLARPTASSYCSLCHPPHDS